MFKSRLYWRILANFAFLLLILTAMTLLTLNILSQIDKNFKVASGDTRVLANLEQLRRFLNDVPAAASDYVFTGSADARATYESGWRDFDLALVSLQKDLSDSLLIHDTKRIRDLYFGWMQNVGDKLIELHDKDISGDELKRQIGALAKVESEIQYMASARRVVRDLFQKKIASQPQSIERATNLSRDLGFFIGLVNVLIAVFALALGFVLTRSITKPIRQLKDGTENIIAGKFEPIALGRSDELGDLANAFNKMSSMLGSNYTRLSAYSELVTTLNNLGTIEEVEQKSLQLLCTHTRASVGALYLLEKDTNTLNMVSGYALRDNGNRIRTLQMGEGIPGQCAAEQRILEVHDVPSSTDFSVNTGLMEMPPKYIIAIPIIFQDKILGVLVLGSLRTFGELEKEIISNSVPQLGVAITNAVNHDATRKLSLEIAKRNEELNSKNDELEKAYRVKSDFLASMSHELRTPLNSIIGFSSVLLGANGDPLTKDQRMAIEKVLKNGRHLLQLINDILDLSKLEAGRMTVNIETEDALAVVSNCTMTVEPMLKSKNLNLNTDIQPDLPALTTDIVKVRQIIVNLLSNAAKFTEQGGISIKVSKTDGMIAFAVKDSGIGIERKNYDLVFEEFGQVDSSNTRKYKGTGLGLPIARRLARMLGGDLTVDSEVGKGSTFTLAIPPVFVDKGGTTPAVVTLKPAPAAAPGPKPQYVPPQTLSAVAKGSQILCIDDDPDVIEILRKYLIPEGYSVTGALSGDEGIAAASQLKPALITLDIMMPKKDGWQVLRELKQNPATRGIPVVMHSIIENRPLAVSLGAVDVLTKPTEPNRLLALVKHFCKATDKSVLVVDDNKDFASAVQLLMKQDGLDVKIATGGKEALAVLKGWTPAMIFLDLMMPGMDGFEVVNELQKNEVWKKIPVVILSGKELTETEFAKLNSHITEYLKKDDLSQLDLSSTVKRILNTSLQLQQ